MRFRPPFSPRERRETRSGQRVFARLRLRSPLSEHLSSAFTLIELLLVVGIIAILALIAVPNMLEASVRAKVSRAKADLRTVEIALEAYRTDNPAYPVNHAYDLWSIIPPELTTPISYLLNNYLEDPFMNVEVDPFYALLARYYTYQKIVDSAEADADALAGFPAPIEAIDEPGSNLGAKEKYGPWRILSNGPDRRYSDLSFSYPLLGSDIPYDPTNGTISFGNILRTPESPEGRVIPWD